MTIKVADYSLRGSYVFQGTAGGLQRGEVSLYDDGKVIGRIRDANPGAGVRFDKLFFGLMNPDGLGIDFLKVAPSYRQEHDIKPIIWSMVRANDNGPFEGIWLTAVNLPAIEGFEKVMKATGQFPDLELLANIPVAEMQAMWGFGQVYSRYNDFARAAGQTGNITLTKR